MKSQVYNTPPDNTRGLDSEESLFQGVLHDAVECTGSFFYRIFQ
jgi:hypothetical protein